MPRPDLQQLTPALHRLRIPTGPAHLLNCYLWLGADGVTLIDTGWPDSADLIADALSVLGRQRTDVTRIVLTHFHEDHTGSAAEIARWADVEVIAGAADAPFVAGAQRGPLPRLTDREKTIHAEFDEPSHGPACRVDREVRDGDVLDFAGGTRVIGVPGHTPGSIALYLPDADAVLTGDAVAEFDGEVILGVFDVDRDAASRSLARIAATRARIAGLGHGEAVLEEAYARIGTATDPFAPSAGAR
ncbi:MBL fold metallo-hydrolase [Rhodococcus sp. TAF43]|uniref:MBL fold metallo-hydrolase n=1 Tax=Rhodococcus sp. TAF43 TaxID=3237483 RepID=UPI003F9E986C